MQIQLNGECVQLGEAVTVALLLQQYGYGDRKVAVEINQQIVPRSAHASRAVADGDCIEIVTAFGGG